MALYEPPPDGSRVYRLTWSDALAIAKGAGLAAAGAAVAYLLAEVVPAIDQSTALGVAVAAIASVVLNTLRKFFTDTRG